MESVDHSISPECCSSSTEDFLDACDFTSSELHSTPLKDESNCSSPSNGKPDSSTESELDLYNRYSMQQKEIERLEEQNAEYRDKLIRTMRERDLNDELLKNVQSKQKKDTDELEKQIRDLEVQLKTLQEKHAAREVYFTATIKDLTDKNATTVTQLTRKADQAEREKNEAVVKYATREAEVMRVRAETQKKDAQLRESLSIREKLEKSQSQENTLQLEKQVQSLQVELEKMKHERFDLDNRLKMSDKRIEASQTSMAELRQQCDTLRKQLIQTKEDRSQAQDELRNLINKTQVQESRIQHESDGLREVQQENNRLREHLKEANDRLEDVSRENLDLLTKLQDLEDKLLMEEEGHLKAQREADRLQSIEQQVLGTQKMVEQAKSAQEIAERERENGEKEASECRLQAERMLQITEQLTERNTALSSELDEFRERCRTLQQQVIEAEGTRERMEDKLLQRERDLEEARGSKVNENSSMKGDIEDLVMQVQTLKQKLAEERNDLSAYKKKHSAQVKDLRSELINLRRQAESAGGAGDNAVGLMPPSVDTATSSFSRSRTNSVASLDRITSISHEDSSGRGVRDVKMTHTPAIESPSPQVTQSMQQAMIDKIVLLQRKLARRQEKIEFLEEHVKQCLEELQKKTKIIQSYILREEASLLLPSDSSMEQVPYAKKGSSYALMGSMFTTGGEKKSVQLMTEINSRLQAVLEDALLKNITLKSSLDSLACDVSRLQREKRLLSITTNKNTFEAGSVEET